jgi:glycosyltransferase involved in cell wall biosynthesis
MNILILSDGFPPESSAGAENIAYITAMEYVRIGHTVTVVTINKNLKKGTIKKIKYNGIQIIQIESNYHERYIAYVSLYNFKVLREVRKILKIKYDLAHIHNIHRYISYGVIGLLRKHNIKTILTMHDAMSIDYGKFTQGIDSHDLSDNPHVDYKVHVLKTILFHRTRYNPFRNIIIKHYLGKVDKIVSVSHSLKFLLNKNGIKNIVTVHNGLPKLKKRIGTSDEIKEFKIRHGITKEFKILLWAGRVSTAKGGGQLIKLMKKIVREKNNIKLFIAGGDINIPNGLENNIILSGWLTQKEMSLAYCVADIVLVPSIYPDPFPTVVLESLRAGVPVIATCFGGAQEAIVSGETGYIVNPFNINSFYKRIINIIENDNLRKEMTNNARQVFSDKFTANDCIDRYIDVVNDI